MDFAKPKHLSQLARLVAVQITLEPAPESDVTAGVGADVTVGGNVARGAPRWSGQHCISRQQGNIHATSSGTKQHTDCASCMQFAVHTFMSVHRPV